MDRGGRRRGKVSIGEDFNARMGRKQGRVGRRVGGKDKGVRKDGRRLKDEKISGKGKRLCDFWKS